eukprot:scaffold4386_cov105-Isochrysis_galbana.AAC.7
MTAASSRAEPAASSVRAGSKPRAGGAPPGPPNPSPAEAPDGVGVTSASARAQAACSEKRSRPA